ncbi:DUF4329 domain-containing protein [Aliiroseovarius subalbicans]|uniref:DUF4329 domain-containing protein n=1 Tax=Aliiroseovarius subalbicans TaxID=2925840 RepID=UPI001F5784C1|nr:DUF4329 domain-containing protein [Aliiroseovarius subalbicans]MCI2400443.1 DUF4329 domain-containing protein [Aliiroseovarius subalbicans]
MRALVSGLVVLLAVTGSALALDSREVAFVKSVFAQLQPISIRKNREYCGYIGYDAGGQLIASKANRGRKGSCRADDPVGMEVIIASYHTHGAFSTRYFNEIPSGDDMEGDEAEGIDGWVATPGGRLWYIDSQDMVTSQICGIGCLPMDPDFIKGDMGLVAQSYSYEQLVRRLEE